MFPVKVFPVEVYVDNTAAKDLIIGNKQKGVTKYVATKFYLSEQLVEEGLIHFNYVKSEDNLSDAMTKQLPKPAFKKFKAEIFA